MIRSHFDRLRREKGLRENRDLSIRTVAAETGLSFNTIQRVRRQQLQRVYASTLDTLCRYFAVASLCDLVEYTPDPEPGEEP